MVIVFDLDDTLYEELTYVKSGFKQVSFFISNKFGINQELFYKTLLDELKKGRGKIFDNALASFSIYSKANVKNCLQVYRQHFPDISLDKDADDCLNRFKNYPLYIVTDGNKLVQNKKIEALGLKDRVKQVFITHRYGIKNAKPSPFCFNKICVLEQTSPNNVLYVGDNVSKDFIGIKPLGYRTVRVLKGNYKELIKPNEFEATFKIESLNELNEKILLKIFKY
ncbi:MAG: haloacid dehalogenase [Bacteroidetes bacterium GWA2_31_9]|nr:MAG: haloacid dehalogenase [Bacteroidetes bacterium GWA2_31_9]